MKILLELKGSTSLLMHNERLSDPDDQYTRQIKEITDKGKDQTDTDKQTVSKLEWRGGLYDENGIVVMPMKNIIRCLREAAAIIRAGRKIARGLTPLELAVPFQTDGSGKVDELIAREQHFHRCMVKVPKGGRVKRTRPIFQRWGLSAPFELMDDQLSFSSLQNIAETAGRAVGLGDARILGHGRFEAKIKKA
jgi:hypothetical protein